MLSQKGEQVAVGDSTFLIKSTQNKSFGTGFCVARDEQGSFLVTCKHVVEACQQDALEVNGLQTEVVAISDRDDIDLALLYVNALVEVVTLPLQCSSVEEGSAFVIKGYKVHRQNSHKKEVLNGSIKKVSKIESNHQTTLTYELSINTKDSIEKGYSGSAIVCEDSQKVIAVATDRNSSGKHAYAIPISYLKEVWQGMPDDLWDSQDEKESFSREVFTALDDNPLLLFSTDAYNHVDYIEHIRQEAISIFGKTSMLEINCGRFSNMSEVDKFFTKLAKRLKLSDEVEDSIDFEDALIEHFEASDPLKIFILIIGFERLQEDVRNAFAVSLRNLQEEYAKHFHLVIFGGEKLIQLKYSTGIHSYFNTFDQKQIPAPTFAEWKVKFSYLTATIFHEVLEVTGGYGKLTEQCFKAEVKSQKEAERFLLESSWKSELFRLYRNDNLMLLFDKEVLGDAHPYSDDELLYRLYWDNLIVEKRGKFVWRSPFVVELGKAYYA
jgi:hypothetical protein